MSQWFISNCASTFMLNAHFTVVSFSPDPTKTLPQFQHLLPCSLGNLTDTIDVLPRWWLWQSTVGNVTVRLQMQKNNNAHSSTRIVIIISDIHADQLSCIAHGPYIMWHKYRLTLPSSHRHNVIFTRWGTLRVGEACSLPSQPIPVLQNLSTGPNLQGNKELRQRGNLISILSCLKKEKAW